MIDHPSHPSTPAADTADGLSADELRAEQAGELPEREAMSILDVGNIGAGLPIPADVGDALGTAVPTDEIPVGDPVDQIHLGGQLFVDELPTHASPMVPPVSGGLIGIPELPDVPDVPADAETLT